MLSFFKPISNETAKKSSQKRVLPQVAPPPLKRPCPAPQQSVDLVSNDKQPQSRADKLLDPPEDDVPGHSHGQCRLPQQRHTLSTAHRQPPAEEEGMPATVNRTHVYNAALCSSVSAKTHTAHEGQLQRSNSSSIDPSMAPVRRFKGVPYAPDADSIQFLTNMGFTHDQAIRALKVTQGNIERAANWLLSGM